MFGLFDKAEVTVSIPQYVAMEDSFDCLVDIIPKSTTNLRKVLVELICRETAVSRGSTDTYNKKEVYSDQRIPRENFKIFKGESLRIKEIFRLPQFTTPTISVRNHFVEWYVRVRLDVPWWPDTRKEVGLYVVPMMLVPEMTPGGDD